MAPFVDGRCKTPIEEIQAAVDGAIFTEQAVKLRQCLNHMDELEKHQAENDTFPSIPVMCSIPPCSF